MSLAAHNTKLIIIFYKTKNNYSCSGSVTKYMRSSLALMMMMSNSWRRRMIPAVEIGGTAVDNIQFEGKGCNNLYY
jgi:hypothetical protein